MFYLNEVRRGFAGLGTYSLSDEFAAAKQSPDEVQTISAYSPQEIIERIRDKICSEKSAVSPDLSLLSNVSVSGREDAPSCTQYARAR